MDLNRNGAEASELVSRAPWDSSQGRESLRLSLSKRSSPSLSPIAVAPGRLCLPGRHALNADVTASPGPAGTSGARFREEGKRHRKPGLVFQTPGLRLEWPGNKREDTFIIFSESFPSLFSIFLMNI